MKRFLIGFALVVLCSAVFGAVPPSGPNSLSYTLPYSKVKVLTATSGSWSASTDSLIVYELRVKSAGMVRIKTTDMSVYQNIWLTDFDLLRVRITSIDLDSCTTDTLMLFGYPSKVAP
jgi:hypothetical protein